MAEPAQTAPASARAAAGAGVFKSTGIVSYSARATRPPTSAPTRVGIAHRAPAERWSRPVHELADDLSNPSNVAPLWPSRKALLQCSKA